MSRWLIIVVVALTTALSACSKSDNNGAKKAGEQTAAQKPVAEKAMPPAGTPHAAADQAVARLKMAEASRSPEQIAADQAAAERAAQMEGVTHKVMSGETVYSKYCVICHAQGIVGAPKLGDTADWKKRLDAAGSLAALDEHAIKGFKGMPPRGACGGCSDQEVRNGVEYMLSQAGLAGGQSGATTSSSGSAGTGQ